MRILPLHINVSQAVAPTAIGQGSLAATLFAPDVLSSSTRQPVLFCLPGGSYTQAYYDFHAPGETAEAYSFARYMAKQGIMVVTLDHLGLGKSTRMADGSALTAEVLSLTNHAAMQDIRERLAQGTFSPDLPPVEIVSLGLGHSMGAYLTILQQDAFQTHEGLVLLGWSNYPLQVDDFIQRWARANGVSLSEDFSGYDILAQMYQFGEHGFVSVYRPASHGLFYTPDVPPRLVEADTALATVVPAPILRQIADIPAIQERAQRIIVPLYLGFGGLIDVSADPTREPCTYGSQDTTLYILPGSGHCHNFAAKRFLLWQRIANWIGALNQCGAFAGSQRDSRISSAIETKAAS